MNLLRSSLLENRRTLALAAPITAGFLGQMLMGWADTIMVGRVGVVPLAACAFANTVIAVPLVFGFGVLSSVSVRASIAHGGGHARMAGEALRAGLFLAGFLGIAIAAGIHAGIPLLPLLGQKPEVNASCVTFLILCGWSILPVFLTTAAKNFSEALSRPWMPFWIVLAGVFLNIFLNWILIYGNLGASALGLDGAGLATLIARVLVMIALFAYVFLSPRLSGSLPRHWFGSGLWSQLRLLLVLGLPAGGLHLFEVTGFAIGSLMMGWISIDALAAHQVAMTCVATSFMIPLGLSQAMSVRVGQSRGARDFPRLLPIVAGGMGLALAAMIAAAALFVLAGPRIAGWFIDSPAVTALAAQLLLIAGVFQIFDGLQVVASGTLRGFEDTRLPMIIGAFAYWAVALPVSWICAFRLGFGAPGIWLGFLVGLGVAASALIGRVAFRLRSAQ